MTRILDIAQIALLEFGQRMQRKSSAAKVSICCVKDLTRIVTLKPLRQVVSQTRIKSFLMDVALKNVNIQELCHS
jgi:hypothetical protein